MSSPAADAQSQTAAGSLNARRRPDISHLPSQLIRSLGEISVTKREFRETRDKLHLHRPLSILRLPSTSSSSQARPCGMIEAEIKMD
ncbi:hypothetical protein CTA1_11547 [Colletotrichum tanaceti]|uniref:Uncharacterized protein n=1 Tax=Colletotrichum tanaceti TaxID=1306861 RepID=A0A4U6XPH5_9PEZI|nr:hypothetical protein CTA1_11547 [Colletotrichum tanaceti]